MVSVVIPLYNKECSIRDTVVSVLTQTYKDFELIIVDDGSTDNSSNIVKSIQDYRIKYFYKENGGVSAARNYGVRMASHDWILFLDADDVLYENCLSLLCAPLSVNRNIDICCGRYHKVRNNVQIVNSKFNYEGFVKNNYKWIFQNKYSLRTGCCIIRRSILLENPFDEFLSRFEDMKCILEWIRKRNVYRIDAPVMKYKNDFSELSKFCKDPLKDFVFHLDFQCKSFWEKCMLGKLLYLGWIGYSHQRDRLKSMYGKNIMYLYLGKLQLVIEHVNNEFKTNIKKNIR